MRIEVAEIVSLVTKAHVVALHVNGQAKLFLTVLFRTIALQLSREWSQCDF